MGDLVDNGGIRADPEKTAPILEFPTPTNNKQVRSFYGMCSWYRRYIKGFAGISAPLTVLTAGKKEKPFMWTDEAQQSFEQLKVALTTAHVLSMPTMEGQWILETDASDHAIGGCLKQMQDGEERVITYYSRQLSKAARNYSTTVRECLAVITFVEKARPYIEGVPTFTVVTDHASLVWLLKRPEPQGRIARWILRLQQFNYTIVHRAGKEMVTADALSRIVNLIEVSKTDRADDPEYDQLFQSVTDSRKNMPCTKYTMTCCIRKIISVRISFMAPGKLLCPEHCAKRCSTNVMTAITPHMGEPIKRYFAYDKIISGLE